MEIDKLERRLHALELRTRCLSLESKESIATRLGMFHERLKSAEVEWDRLADEVRHTQRLDIAARVMVGLAAADGRNTEYYIEPPAEEALQWADALIAAAAQDNEKD